MAGFTQGQIGALSTASAAGFTQGKTAGLDDAAGRFHSRSNRRTFYCCWQVLLKAKIAGLDDAAVAGFTQGQTAGLNDAARPVLLEGKIAGLNDAADGFTQGQTAELPTDAFGGFDYHKCESLNPDATGGCTYAQFGKIPQGAMLGSGISHIKNLGSNTAGSLGMDDAEKFDPAAVGLDPKNMGTTTLTAIMNKFKSSTLADRETVKFISSEFFQDMLHKDNTASTYSITNDLDGFLKCS